MKTMAKLLIIGIAIGNVYCTRKSPISIQRSIRDKWQVDLIEKNEKTIESLYRVKAGRNDNMKTSNDTLSNASEVIEILTLPEILKMLDDIKHIEFTDTKIKVFDKENNLMEEQSYAIKDSSNDKMIIIIKGREYTIERTDHTHLVLKSEYATFHLSK